MSQQSGERFLVDLQRGKSMLLRSHFCYSGKREFPLFVATARRNETTSPGKQPMFAAHRRCLSVLLAFLVAALCPPSAGARDDTDPISQGQPLSAWVKDLKSKDPATCRVALRAIGALGPKAKSAVGPVTKLLADGHPLVIERAAQTLGQIGPEAKEATGALVKLLRYPDSGVRKAAVEAVTRIGPVPKEAVPDLAKSIVQDQESKYRLRALDVLGRMGPEAKDAEAILTKLVGQDHDAPVRKAAAEAVTRINPPGAVPVLTQMLQDKDGDNRVWAAMTLRRMGPNAKEAVPALVKLVGRIGDPAVRSIAAVSLAGIDPENGIFEVALLRKNLSGQGGRFDPALAVAILLRKGAAARDATPELIRAMKSDDLVVSLSAPVALGRIGGAAVGPLIKVVKDNPDPILMGQAAYALSRIGPEAKEAAGILRKLCESEDRYQRIAAAYALARVSPEDRKKATAVLKGEIQKEKGASQSDFDALLLLTWLHTEESKGVADHWSRQLATSEPWGRLAGAYGLAELGPDAKSAVKPLRAALTDEEPIVRILAAYALAQASAEDVDRKAAIGTLNKILEDRSVETTSAVTRDVGLIMQSITYNPSVEPEARAFALATLCDALAEKEPGDRFPTSYLLNWVSHYAVALAMSHDEPKPSVQGLAKEALRRIEADARPKPNAPPP
jgi:HEAT repeat protein